MTHPFVYAELHTSHPEAARAFYADLFGWAMRHHETDGPGGAYTEIKIGEGPEAGLMGYTPFDDGRSQWLPYIRVEELGAATRRAVELGATLHVERTEVPGAGWFTWLQDPTGARFALWEKRAESAEAPASA
jgi:predicted enzyme related to lactoylglutathione lyase